MTGSSDIAMPAVTTIPLLRSDLVVQEGQGCARLLQHDVEYVVSGPHATTIASAFAAFDGTRDIDSIAADKHIDTNVLRALFAGLAKSGLALNVSDNDRPLVSPEEFLEASRRLFQLWKNQSFEEQLWRGLAEGGLPPSVFTGWLIESYHFIQGVNDRLALAVMQCYEPALRSVFAEHFVEEYDHGSFFLDALEAHGIDRQQTMTTRPLPGTYAVLNHMRNAARRDPLEYAVCSGLLESTGRDAENALRFLEQARIHYAGDRQGVIEPIAAHVNLDQDYGHSENFAALCSLLEPIPVARASRALAAGSMLAETLQLWSRDIVRSYSDASSPLRHSLYDRGEPSATPAGNVVEDNDDFSPAPDIAGKITSAFGRESVPLLSHHLHWREHGDELIVSSGEMVYRFAGEVADALRRGRSYLDGSSTLSEAAASADVDIEQLSAGLAVLAAESWAVDNNAVYAAPTGQKFFAAYCAICEFWKKDIFAHPFWRLLATGNASRKLVLGWLVEFYHYIDSSNEHMAASVAMCRDDDVIQLELAKHYSEEYNHNEMFFEGLVEAGLDRHELLTAPPLPSTRALINYITETALSDTLSYAAMHGIFQVASTSKEWSQIDTFYELLLSHYAFGAPILKSFRDHAALDAELGHDEIVFELICDRVEHFAPKEVDAILTATRRLVEHFVLFFEGILDYYGALETPYPRRPVNVRGAV